jgi:hypothetical protein
MENASTTFAFGVSFAADSIDAPIWFSWVIMAL